MCYYGVVINSWKGFAMFKRSTKASAKRARACYRKGDAELSQIAMQDLLNWYRQRALSEIAATDGHSYWIRYVDLMV